MKTHMNTAISTIPGASMFYESTLKNTLKSLIWLFICMVGLSYANSAVAQEPSKAVLLSENGEAESSEATALKMDRRDGYYVALSQLPQASGALSQPVTLRLRGATLDEALNRVSEETGLEFVYGKQVAASRQVSVDLESVPAKEALQEILRGTGRELMLSSGGQLVLVNQAGATGLPKLKGRGADFKVRPVAIQAAEVMPIAPKKRQGTITGTVTDSLSGEAIPGVNVVIAGTQQGSATDVEGQYTISGVESGTYTLRASFVGYSAKTVEGVEVGEGQTTEVDFQLVESGVALEGLVVTAFGIERERESVGYSVSEVQGADLTKARVANIAEDLSGRVAGVNASQMGGGVAGSSGHILIRGAGSLDGDNQPLYVINGMPMSNNRRVQGAFESGASVTDKGDGIQHINPDDIESITVLKGGAAAALYGSQAANGVVLITTKGGTADRDGIGVQVNSNVTVGTINKYPNLQTQYGQGYEGRRPQNQDEALSTGRLGFGERIDCEPTVNFDGVERPYCLHPVKEQMQTFYRPSTRVENSIAFEGGVNEVTYRLGLSNLEAQNIQPNSGYSRYSANLNMRALLGDKLSVTGMVQYTYDEGNNRPITNYAPGNANWGVTLLANTVPIEALAPGYDENTLREKEWQHVAIATNPYFVVNRMQNTDSKNRIMSQASVTYDVLPNLYVKGDIMRDFEVWESEYFVPVGTAAIPDGQYRSNEERSELLNVQAIVGYDTEIKDFNISTLAGGSAERRDNNYGNYTGVDFIIPEFHSFTNLQATSTDRGVVRSGTNSLFASVDVDYRQVAFMSVTGRQDWFSTLNLANNNIFYPSVGGSLVLSRIIDLPETISFARLRGSWAQIGAATVDPYAINTTYELQEGGHLGRPVQTMSSALNNPDLRPLTSTTREIGIDLGFFDDRLGIDLTLYERRNEDDMITTSLASSSGATSTILNVGEINNKGIELLLTGEPVRKENFRWSASYNMGYNRNRVVELAPGTPEGGTSLLGHPLSTTFQRDMAYTEDGIPIYNSTSNYELRSDPKPMGPGVPPWTMGLSNTLIYRNFTLDVLLDGKFGNHYFSRHHQYFHRFGWTKETLPGREDGLTVRGVDENGNEFEHHWPASFMATYYNNQGQYGALFMQDGSFIKLRSLSLSYSIPVERLGPLGRLASAEVSLVGRNLAILFSKTEHFDPEQGYNPNDSTQNFSGTQLPRTREIGINLNVGF